MNASQKGLTDNGSTRRERRHFTAEQNVAIVKQHLVDGLPISDLCDKHRIVATQFYQWQKQLFEGGAAAFERKAKPAGPSPAERKIQHLEAKLASKNEVIAELMEECVSKKKTRWGTLKAQWVAHDTRDKVVAYANRLGLRVDAAVRVNYL